MIDLLNKKETIYVEILSPDKVLFQGDVHGLTAYNKEGEFDILPLHANFISLIKDQLVLHTERSVTKEIWVGRGVLRCVNNKISVYLGVD